MDVRSFDEIRDEFNRWVARVVWCTVATVDRQGRPRSRIMHPIWEGSTGWVGTRPGSLKEKHLAANPYVSLTYWDPLHEQVYVDAKATWEESVAEKERVWRLFKVTPPPLGFDPALFWKSPDDEGFGLLKLEPWRVELWNTTATAAMPSSVWRPEPV